MIPDVLFWFYKEFDLCRERLERFRRENAGVRVFALYGGALDDTVQAREAVGDLVDDFYVYPYDHDAAWKWRYGDHVLLTWYRERGRALAWETIFILQWDMLVCDTLDRLFASLRPGELLLSGYRPIREVTPWWAWSSPDRPDQRAFRAYLQERFGYEGELYACLFVVICFPRRFLEACVDVEYPDVGFLEYQIPTLAHVLGFPVCRDHDFEPWWGTYWKNRLFHRRREVLNAYRHEVPRSRILHELARPDGARLFHPVSARLPGWVDMVRTRTVERTAAYVLVPPLRLVECVARNARRLRRRIRRLARP